MRPFDIFISYISWEAGGKLRPVLVYEMNASFVRIYPITTQFNNKSEAIKKKYFKVNYWVQAGLDKQSYVDTGTKLKLPLSMLDNITPIGRLTEADKRRLIEFIKREKG